MALIRYVLAIIFIFTTVQCDTTTTSTTTNPDEPEAKESSNTKNAGAAPVTRTGRIMTIFNKEPNFGAKRYGPPQDMIRSRSDRFPPPPAAAGVQQRFPGAYQRHPGARGPGPQILRRIQNNIPNGQIQRLPQNQIPRYEIQKSSRYSATKNGPQHPSGKGGPYRPQKNFDADLVDTVAIIASGLQHPNALTSGNTAQNAQFGQQFKPSPNFGGNVVVRPIVEQQQQQPKYTQQFKYPDQRQQHNFPNQQQLHQREPFPLKQAAQQPQLSFPQQLFKQQVQQGQQESLLPAKLNQNHVSFENAPEIVNLPVYSQSTPSHSYAVYEDEEPPIANPAQSKNTQDYIKFMSSNGYFLPKLEPNYRKIDDDRDQQQYRQQQTQQQLQYLTSNYDSLDAASTYQRQYQHKQQQQQQQQLQKQQLPIKVSQLFFHDNPTPPASTTVVRSSYLAGQLNNGNNFVVNSDGQKVSKRIVSGPESTLRTTSSTSTDTTTPASASYNHFQFSSSRYRTPEPVRFEFTERDAIMPATYTHSPNSAQQRNSIAVGTDIVANSGGSYVARSTARIPTTTQRTTTAASDRYNDVKPVNEYDAEDGEDMHQSSSDFYGRVPVHSVQTATSQEPPSEQKDTEDYCESICANVQDDDEEIICGSDGFMYTSEAQMECYASCLHIDVTIQSKGSCSAI